MVATRVWLVLIGLTLITFLLGMLGDQGIVMALLVLLIALVKGRLVADHFMMLRRGAPMWRMLLDGYLITLGVLLGIAFVVAAW